ncbi:hypothetical protein Focb16_v003304 [Fusarium oxysporum f. sp. cubense]|uniref:Uncharacterized protein n=1 Tax=Fusarium oxysporum f. sp. cubense TaxID=61366 RepID=A0A559KL87_FUSOC|nr:hypothetical protein Focb16_v003304 [Fusarium oxysporum f. sp. cubense]
MPTDDEPRTSQDSTPLPRDVELGPADHQPESRIRGFQILFQKYFLSLCGWILAFVSTAVSIAALLPAFRGLLLSDKQLRLAEWSALKDYLDQCKEDSKAGHISEDCKAALAKSLPPPPGLFYSDNLDLGSWGTSYRAGFVGLELQSIKTLAFMVLPWSVLMVCWLHRTWRRTRSRHPDKYASATKSRERPTRKSLKTS